MEFKDRLTNEKLRKKFKSQFDLVRYAISLAENMILTGRETRIKTDVQNRAMQILEEIALGKDKFDEIPVKPEPSDPRFIKHDEPRSGRYNEAREPSDRRESRGKKTMMDVTSKGSSHKKARKIFAE